MKHSISSNCGLALLLLTHLLPATAQTYFPPATPDTDALTSPVKTAQTGVLNTGTDLIKSATERLQAMVWDNGTGKVTLSTLINAGSNPFAFAIVVPIAPQVYTSVSDPDVALAFYQGQLYADVVYLASYTTTVNSVTTTYTRTFFDSYRWDNANKRFDQSTLVRNPLGVATVANLPGFSGLSSIPRLHSSPNIDANSAGIVGLVWQEKSTETAQITVLSPSYSGTSAPPYPNGYTYISEGLVFAESYLAPANANGTLLFPTCGSWRGSLISFPQAYTATPTPALNNAPILFNQTLKPDVAVGSDGRWWVAYLVSAATQGEPPVTAGLNLVLRKVDFDCNSITGTYYSQAWQSGVTLNPPRVAASPDPARPDDVEVVQAWAGTPCQEGFGTRYYYEVRNWGRSGGAFRPNYSLVSQVQVTGTSGRPAYDPVVAFYGSESTFSGTYVVAWTGENYPANANGQDVWSRSLNAGVPLTPDYSRVNYASPTNANPIGNQRTPSVAARYSGTSNAAAYCWADDNTSTVCYRYSTLAAGSGALNRPAADGGTGSTAPARRLEAFPNPFGGSVEFRVSLRPGEAVQSIQVTDLSGRVLDTVPTAAGTAARPTGTAENTPPPYIQLEPAAGPAGWFVPGAARHQPAQRNPAAEQKLAKPFRQLCSRVNRVS